MDFNNLTKSFIIAEIGQNHQGDIKMAKEMILKAKEAGVDCVKFQKSSLSDKFTKKALDRPYVSENSWGKTYGEHKSFLEFTLEEFRELKSYAESLDLVFSASAMDPVSFEHLKSMDLNFIKIGSGDTNNIPMMRKMAQQETPLIVSTGMQNESTILKIHEILKSGKAPLALLHCISSYPCKLEDARLGYIRRLKEMFPDTIIGYSGHEMGIEISCIAVFMGAKIIERHFTLDKSLKGSDHKASLDPTEMKQLVDKIRYLENNFTLPLNDEEILRISKELKLLDINGVEILLKKVSERSIFPCEVECNEKLGKSLVYANDFSANHKLNGDDILVKVSEPKGIPAENFDNLIGKILIKSVERDQICTNNDIE